MKKLAFKYILTCALISASCHGATRSSLKSNYLKAKSQVRSLKSKISRIERKLNQNNNKYISTVKRRQNIDLEIYEIERTLHTSISEFEGKKNKLDKEYKLLLLNSLDEMSTEDLMTKKIVLERIKKDRLEVEFQLDNQKKLQSRLQLLRKQFAQVVSVEKDLYSLVQRLESDKQDYVKSYMKASEESVTLRSKLKKSKRRKPKKVAKRSKKRSSKSVRNTYLAQDFEHPVSKYVTIEHDQKGIYYIFKESSDIKVSKAGTVVHVGTLANYGNVVMVDHGRELKSIFLGSLASNVKKGDRVEAGGIIGETRKSVNRNVMGKVYFEVRQKNKVQNTIKLVRNDNQTQA